MDYLTDLYIASGISRGTTSSIVVFAVIFLLTYLAMQSRQPSIRYPPAIRSLPIVGSLPFLSSLQELPQFFMNTAVKFKSNVFSLYIGSDYAIVLNGREAINEALVRRSTDYAGRPASYSVRLLNPKRRGIIQAQYNATFKRHHQITLSILREFGFGQKVMEQRISQETEDLINRIKDLQGSPFDPSQYLNICTINIINSIAFGERLPQSHPTLERMARYYQFHINSSKKVLDYCPLLRFVPKYKAAIYEIQNRYKNQHDFLLEKIRETLKGDSESFVRRFAEREGEQFDELELKYIINDLLVAGSETTATSIHWSLYYMANNQDIQKRLRDDIDSIIPRDRLPFLDDMPSLPYVEAAILEIMRIRTVAPLSLQRYTTCDTEVGGYFIPANTRVYANLQSVHMDPLQFAEPETFRPERFLDPDGKVIGRDRLIPFSLGKRSCLGEFLTRQEMFLLFAAIIQRFTIQPPDGQDKVESRPYIATTQIPTPFLIRLIPIEG